MLVMRCGRRILLDRVNATKPIYLRVDPLEKLDAIEAVLPPGLRRGRFKAPDALITSLFEPG
jgi:hypothetical protein